ncbi:glycoside hydrolase family 3 N-terminal domain-containing protein [Blastococcus sp. TF02A-30]|uniref:glycoside hydrolase family 3 N-terminal domain-containing protein n=1 Tax=Blastococcus sp. TF02A-30 TaxID=2250580 RepID=UPI000DE8210C|nr:glycoside hydrolase family 3 N-terminal domain-containing protein [Blastococcus sp. TF02A-30]RBY87989.1 glycoside hydrolase family 3 protein [Blastococcus sp. TF02A-30]
MRSPALRTVALLGLVVGGLLPACGNGSEPAQGSGATTSSTTTTTTPPADDPESAVAAALESLDRRAEIAQLFVVGLAPEELDRGPDLAAEGVGGLFLRGRPEQSVTDLAGITGGWQEQAPGPGLWIAADQEGGSVQTLKGEGFEQLPPATEQGDLPADQLRALADGMGAALSAAGVNLNLAPVVDVVPAGTEAGNEPIGYYDRQYGSTGGEVTAAASTVVDGLAAARVTATLKHFPGLGRVRENTDTSADVVDPVTTAGDDQVTAFAGTLTRTSAAHPMVMMSSATYPQIDPSAPAAFSPVVIGDLLRGRLAFAGPVISDDLGAAEALAAVPVGERAVRFLAAGGTLVLTVAVDTYAEMLDAVEAEAESDPAFGEQVDAAVRTALLAKAHAGLLG